jgi:hypothetical protein
MQPSRRKFNAALTYEPCGFGTLAKKQAASAQESGAIRCRNPRQTVNSAVVHALAHNMHPLDGRLVRARDVIIADH